MLSFGLGGAVVAAGSLLGLGAHVHRVGRRPRSEGSPRPAVVLGARVFPDGQPSDALVDRVRVGVELQASGLATTLLFSGGSPDARPTEAAVMRRLAVSLGAKPEALWVEERSRSTFENAVECARLLTERRVEAVWLVTCDFHVARATAYFRRAGIEVAAAPSRRELAPAERLLVTARELGGLLRRPGLLRHVPR